MRTIRPVLVIAVAAFAFSTTAAADGAAEAPVTPEAEKAGITKPGDAYMGWQEDRSGAATESTRRLTATVAGIDVSKWQGTVDWQSHWDDGKRFAYVKATEGTYNKSATFAQQYNGSYNVGMIRGSYHFANPRDSGGATQAEFFVNNGGGWSGDGKTLPGVLDIEWDPYSSDPCWGLSDSAMVSWIKSFTSRYRALTGRDAVIYTNTNWWKDCTANSDDFGSTNPLWIARYNSTVGELPAGWGYYTFWQYTDTPLDQNRFNGDMTRLKALANG